MIRVFGITGTNGKTTASWMLRNILEQSGPCGLIGTIEHVAGNLHYAPENTTPGKMRIAQLLEKMADQNIRSCVMEVSSHGIDQGRIDDVIFSGVGFTNLSRDHMDYHGSMEQYYQTKKKLFENNNVCSAVNVDDGYGRRLYEEMSGKYSEKVLNNFSLDFPYADFYGKIKSHDILGTSMTVFEKGKRLGAMHVRLAGKHFASNALLALTMARQAGIPFEDIRKGIESLKKISGRMECIGDKEDTLGIVDFAHTPDSFEKLLETVAEMKRGKLICVFGCGGFRDKGKRRMMGEVAGRYSDYCIITNDNPRGEPPENIITAIEEGVHPTGCGYCIVPDRYQAIKRAVSLSDKWDIIVVTGKGHEIYQYTGNECVPFDDRKVLKELLEKKYEKTYNETD